MNIKLSRLLLLTLLFTGCVTARQHQELQSAKNEIEAENEKFRKENERLKVAGDESDAKIEDLSLEISELIKDTTRLGQELRSLTGRYAELNELNEMISSKNSQLLQNAAEENRKLLIQLDGTRGDLQNKEDSLVNLAAALQSKELNLQQLNEALEVREARVAELESRIAKQEAAVNELKDIVSRALLGFENKGLTVEQRNGKVYISLTAKLLFPSGSAQVDAAGKKALVDLAKAIENQKDLEIVVEGHTDTDKINSANIPHDNWELSVLRATAVVKIMTENSNINPALLSASGRSEFLPINPEDKAANRRIEIILTPNLNELFKLLN